MNSKNENIAPFFIFGSGRSGTSLLSRMLNQHSRLAVPYESHIFNTFYPLLKYYGDLSVQVNREKLVDDILKTDVLNDWMPPLEKHQVLSHIKSHHFGGIFEAIMESWSEMMGKIHWGEKTPHHIDYWKEIFHFFPNAKIIHIVRDGRDVALSFLRVRFGPKTFYSAAHHWTNYLKKIEEIKQSKLCNRLIEIKYENLLENPEDVLRSICSFLNEKYEHQLLDYHKVETTYKTDFRNLSNLQKPLLSKNKNKWQKLMNPDELRIFEAIGGDYLLKYGYNLSSRQLPVLLKKDRMDYYLTNPFNKIKSMLANTKGQKDAFTKHKIILRRKFEYYLEKIYAKYVFLVPTPYYFLVLPISL